MAEAARNCPQPKQLWSVDLDGKAVRAARFHLWRAGLSALVRVERRDAMAALSVHVAARRRMALVFVDHSHEYQPVRDVCEAMAEILHPGVFVRFTTSTTRATATRQTAITASIRRWWTVSTQTNSNSGAVTGSSDYTVDVRLDGGSRRRPRP